MAGFSFVITLVIGVLLIPVVKKLSLRWGRVAQPRQDRWHRTPTPVLGGVAIFAAFCLGLLVNLVIFPSIAIALLEIMLVCAAIFLLGLMDDFKQLSPPAKLVGQILAATLAISLGFTTDFFSPRIENPILAQLPNILLTYIWLIGITNAFNLLDNMDGLAGGIGLIAALILSFFFWQSGDKALLTISLSIAGSVLAFLFFNFPPASIFMGDSGSLFLGFSLALLAIARQPQASNVFAVMGVPTLLFLLPILDTTLVTFTRILRGQSPVQGGRDHTSHRLIAFGLGERQAVLILYAVALLSGLLAALLESIQYWFSLVLVPLLVITLALLAAYLGGLKIVTASSAPGKNQGITRILLDLTIKRRMLEVLLDFFLIGFAYYLAILTYYRFTMSEDRLDFYLRSLPFALGVALIIFYVSGVYRGVWRYVDTSDLFRYSLASVLSSLCLGLIFFIFNQLHWSEWAVNYPPGILILFPIFLLLCLAASRASFRFLYTLQGQQLSKSEARVLLVGSGDSTEIALRWLLMNTDMGFRPIGIVDDDPFKQGRQIHGVQVIGGIPKLANYLEHSDVQGVILIGLEIPAELIQQVQEICQDHTCWVRRLRLELEDI